MRNTSETGTAVRRVLVEIRQRLPPDWSAEARTSSRATSLTLRAPDGRSADVSVLARKSLVPRDVPALAAGIDRPTLVVSSHLSGRARDLLGQAGLSYADATGNLRLAVSSPAIYLEGIGADRNPDRISRPLHSLRGAAAARVVRALSEFPPPYGVRALAELSSTPLGTVSRVVTFLETEALVTRDERKQIVAVDRSSLLTMWAKDYGVATTNLMRPYLEPRGLGALWPKLTRLSRYAATGSVAAASVAPTRLAMIYVDDADSAARSLDLIATDAGANVWLLEPWDGVVFERTRTVRAAAGGETATEVVAVSVPQAIVDLLTSPGRGPQEAEALLGQLQGDGNE